MIRIAKEFVGIMENIKAGDQELQRWVREHPEEVPLDLHNILQKMHMAVLKL